MPSGLAGWRHPQCGGAGVAGREITGGRRGSLQGNPPAGLAMSVDSGHLSGALASIGHSAQPPTVTLDSMGQTRPQGSPELWDPKA